MNSPKEKGERSEGMILGALLRAGKVVLQPFGDNQRYDLVLDEDGKFVRVQCKTGRFRDGAVRFRTCSTHYHRGHTTRSYHGGADIFGIYCPELDKVYLVPVDAVPDTEGALRIEAPKNGQAKGVRLAEEFELRHSPS